MVKTEYNSETIVEIGIPGLHRSYTWTVVIMDTMNPLWCADFLSHYGLILDCSNGRLIDESTHRYTHKEDESLDRLSLTVNNHYTLTEVQSLLQEF